MLDPTIGFRTASCAANIWITDVLSPPIEGLAFILRNNWLYRRTTATKFVLSWRSHQRWRHSSFRIPPILSQTFGVVEHGRKTIDLIEFINRCNLRMFKQQTFCFRHNQLPQFCIFWCSGRFTSSSPLVPCKAQSIAAGVEASEPSCEFKTLFYYVHGLQPSNLTAVVILSGLVVTPDSEPSRHTWALSLVVKQHLQILIWVNYNELTTSSLEIIVSKGNHPQMALIQVSELL